MKSLEFKTLHVRWNKMALKESTSCKTNEIGWIENASCKVK